MEKKKFEEKLLTISEVKEILKEREESGIELGYVQRKTYDYVLKFTTLSVEDSKRLFNTLIEKFNIEEKIAVQIVNLQYQFPETIDEIDLIFDKADSKLDEAQKEELLNLLKEYKELIEMK